jgi:hypothetical protein
VSEIEITLPTVQYGNVKVRATPEELGADLESPHSLGVALAVFQNLFTQGWVQGSQMDVSAPQGASQEAAPGDPQAAADRLAEGRPPRTVDEANEMATQIIKDTLGASVEEEYTAMDYNGDGPGDVDRAAYSEAPPWDKPATEVKKPWEAEVTAPAVLDAAW